MPHLSNRELEYCARIRQKDSALRAFLLRQALSEMPDPKRWFEYVVEVKEALGNISNSLSFIATLLAKDYLTSRFAIQNFDAAAKPQGASGPDIEIRTMDGRYILGEVKTTRPYQPGFGAQQKMQIKKDLMRLTQSNADHKFMFVTDEDSFKTLCQPYYAAYARDVEIVNLMSGPSYRHD